MSNGTIRYWISWNEPGDDSRPVGWPLPLMRGVRVLQALDALRARKVGR